MSKKLTHEEFIAKVIKNNQFYINGDIEIIGRYVDKRTRVKCRCRIHSYIWDAYPSVLYGGGGCKLCATEAKYLKTGINDLWTTRPDIAKLLKNKDEGYKYTKNSHRKATFVCPCCNFEQDKVVRDVCNDGYSCARCGDGVSYPNKFGRIFLSQLPITNHQCEYQPDWAKPYFYDNYFEYNNMQYILEMDGFLHYEESSLTSQPLKDRQNIDIIKTNLAIQHNIHVIRINCKNSSCDYIKNNIVNSEFNNLFDLSNIDWDLCDSQAQKSLIKQACDIYMSDIIIIQDIANILHISRPTVRKYLKKGAKFGWCNYTTDTVRKRSQLHRMKAVIVLDNNNNVIHSFSGVASCSIEMSNIYNKTFFASGISKACRTHKPYKGFNFRFANEFEQNEYDYNN